MGLADGRWGGCGVGCAPSEAKVVADRSYVDTSLSSVGVKRLLPIPPTVMLPTRTGSMQPWEVLEVIPEHLLMMMRRSMQPVRLVPIGGPVVS